MFFKKQKSDQTGRPRRSVIQRSRGSLPGAVPVDTSSNTPRGVYSYRASRSQRQETFGRVTLSQAERMEALKRRLRWLRSTPRLVAVLGILLVVCMLLRLDTRATVVPMDDAKGQVFLRSMTTYQDAVQRTFASSWLNINKVTVNTAQISQDIKAQFPELKTVSVSLPLTGSRPVVYVQPAVPVLILVNRAGAQYVIDTDGKALIIGNQVAHLSKLQLPTVTDESGLVITPGAITLPQASVSFTTEVLAQLKAKQVPIEALTLPAGAGELHIKVKDKPYFVKFNLHGNAREEAGGYLAVKHALEATNKVPGQYIDVRVPGRAYYK